MTAHTARLALVLAALMWSTNGIIIKLAEASPMAMTCMRCGVSAAVLLLYGQLRRLPLFTFSPAQICGALAYFLMSATIAVAMKLTTAATAIGLQYTAPVFVAVLSATILHERILPRDCLQTFLVFLGVLLCCHFGCDATDVAHNALLGNTAALVSGAAYAVFIVSGRIQKMESPIGSIILGNALGFFVTLPWLLEMPFTADNLILGGSFGLFCGGLAFILFSEAICRVEALPERI